MVYVSILFYLVIINAAGELFLIYFGVNEWYLYLIYYPILEEILKYYLVMRFSPNSMRYVIWFALLEIALAKVPVVFIGAESIDYYLILYSIFPLIFHVGSGLFYKRFHKNMIFSILFMISAHICLNASVEIVHSWGFILYVSLSALPFFLLKFSKFEWD